jgi:polysaccharide export outer membrane protein
MQLFLTSLWSLLACVMLWTNAFALQPTAEQIQLFNSLPDSQKSAVMQKVTQGGQANAASANNTPSQITPSVKPVVMEEIPVATPAAKGLDQKNELLLSSQGLKPFGSNLFAGEPTTFAPVNDIPVPSDYILGPGDQLKVHMFGSENNSYVLVVDRNGQVAMPKLEPINVAGLNFREAQVLLTKQVESLGVGIHANITMGELRSFRIFVMGEVRVPGSYLVSGMATMTHALYVSGGLNEVGSYRKVQLKRKGKLIATLDLYDLLLKGDSTDDSRLQPGDVVFIPRLKKQVALKGQVYKPALYELTKERTLADVLALAGGVRPDANLQNAKLIRNDDSQGKSLQNLALNSQQLKKTRVRDGDILIVEALKTLQKQTIEVKGATFVNKAYAWQPNLTLTDILNDPRLFSLNADIQNILVKRTAFASQEIEVIKVDWQNIMLGQTQDLVLNKADQIFVLPNLSGKQNRENLLSQIASEIKKYDTDEPGANVVSMFGEVRSKSQLPLLKKMTLHDAINLAGGLTDEADVSSILVKRTNFRNQNVDIYKVNLESADEFFLHKSDEVYALPNFTLKDERRGLIERLNADIKQYATSMQARNIVATSGAFKLGGELPLVKEMKVADLVSLAGGLSESAMINQAEVLRFAVVNGEKREIERIQIDLNKAMALDQYHNITLQPYDLVMVKQLADWNDATRKITLAGEVTYPGTYTVKPGETLKDVLARAGGFTEWAAPQNSVFTREGLKQQEKQELAYLANELEKNLLMSVKADATVMEGDSSGLIAMGQSLIAKLKETPAVGRLVIGFNPANDELYEGTMGLQIVNGDQLFVPTRQSEVVVMGEVARTNSILYRQSLSVNDYINQSGGLTKRADDESIYVVHGDGSVVAMNESWLGSDSIDIQPGDTIVVPMDVGRLSPMARWTGVSKILSNLAVSAATLKTLGVIN